MISYKHCPLIPTLILISRIKQYVKASETLEKVPSGHNPVKVS